MSSQMKFFYSCKTFHFEYGFGLGETWNRFNISGVVVDHGRVDCTTYSCNINKQYDLDNNWHLYIISAIIIYHAVIIIDDIIRISPEIEVGLYIIDMQIAPN